MVDSEQLVFDSMPAGINYVQRITLSVIKESSYICQAEITCPEDAYALPFVRDLEKIDRELLLCIHLNLKNRVISYEVVGIGTLSSAMVHPRELFKGAILANAASVILCHNHPSGDPEPSTEDIKVTGRLRDAGRIIGIDVLDHIVIGDDSFKSIKELGYFKVCA